MKPEIKGLEPDKLNPRKFGGLCSRSTVILNRAAVENIDDGIPAIATTDAPTLVWAWDYGPWGGVVREILPMKYCQLPDNDKGPLIDSHDYSTIHNDLGYGHEWKTDEHNLNCKLFISSVEKDIRTKIDEKVIDSTSLDYYTYEEDTVEIPKGAEVYIDGTQYKNDYQDDYPLVVRTAWKAKGLSLVIFGADDAAKIQRALAEGIKTSDPKLQEILNQIMTSQKSLTEKINSIQITKEAIMPEPTTAPEKTIEQVRGEACNEIFEIAGKQQNGAFKDVGARVVQEILSGKYAHTTKNELVGEFYKAYSEELVKEGGRSLPSASYKSFSKKENASYSPSRAISIILAGEKRSGLEFEVSDDIQKDFQLPATKGIYLAANFQARAMRELFPEVNQRAHSVGTFAEGGAFSTDEFRPDLLKEVIRNNTVLGQAGSTIISGLNGPLVVPKIVTGLTSYPVAENAAVDKSYIVVDTDTINAARISTATELGRQQFIQTNPGLGGMDQILIKELYGSQNVKLDYYGINGTGLSNQPTGILNMSGMSAPSLSVINLQRIINFKRKVAKLNGLKTNMKWLNSVDVEALLEITRRFEDGNGDRTLFQNGQVEGYASISSNQIPDAVNMFGNWSEFYTLLWGVEELIIADQPKHLNWMVEFSLHRLANFYLRSSEQFAIADDCPVAAWTDLDA